MKKSWEHEYRDIMFFFEKKFCFYTWKKDESLPYSDWWKQSGISSPQVEQLLGDPTKAKNKLGWEAKVELSELVKEMVASDLELMKTNPLA